MEEAKKPKNIIEEMIEMLKHSMKALDEMRGKTLIFNKYRDTQAVADKIAGVLKVLNRKDREGLELHEVWIQKIEEVEDKSTKPLVRNLE